MLALPRGRHGRAQGGTESPRHRRQAPAREADSPHPEAQHRDPRGLRDPGHRHEPGRSAHRHRQEPRGRDARAVDRDRRGHQDPHEQNRERQGRQAFADARRPSDRADEGGVRRPDCIRREPRGPERVPARVVRDAGRDPVAEEADSSRANPRREAELRASGLARADARPTRHLRRRRERPGEDLAPRDQQLGHAQDALPRSQEGDSHGAAHGSHGTRIPPELPPEPQVFPQPPLPRERRFRHLHRRETCERRPASGRRHPVASTA